MRTFIAALEAGSFTAAGDRLQISKKLVSKYIAQLEERLQTKLMHRTTRSLSLTAEGQKYYQGCIEILASFEALEESLQVQQGGLSGTLRIALPPHFGERFLMPCLISFQDRYPGISFDLDLSDEYVDLASKGIDLAVRIGNFEDSALITRRLGQISTWTVASPDFLSKNGQPNHPRDLVRFNCIRDSNAKTDHIWTFKGTDGSHLVRVSGNLRANSGPYVSMMAAQGRGIALCPSIHVKEDVNKGRLTRIFSNYETRKIDVRVAFTDSSNMSARKRLFLNHLFDWFSRLKDLS